MNAADIACTDYSAVSAYTPTSQIVDRLINHGFLVVEDTTRFLGILTPSDLVIHPRTLVVDCLTESPPVSATAEIEEVLARMEQDCCSVLPVFDDTLFVGVIAYADILRHLHGRTMELETRLERMAYLAVLQTAIAGVAHDLNNMIHCIAGPVELAGSADFSEGEARECLRIIGESTLQARHLIEHLRAFSRKDMLPTKIAGTSDALKRNALFFLGASHAPLKVSIPVDLPALPLDARQLSTVTGSLILNAKHAVTDGGRIAMEARVTENGTHVELSVSDTGRGIGSSDLAKVFDPFFTTKPGADGIGLTAVRSLVTKAGGQVDISSSPGQGTSVTVSLPVPSAAARGRFELTEDFLCEALKTTTYIPALRSRTKSQVICELIAPLVESGAVNDERAAVEAVLFREAKMSTGMQEGIALPHARCAFTDRLCASIGISREGMDFGALDHKPSRIFVLSLSPAHREDIHLRFLSEIARRLDDPAIREGLLRADTADEIRRALLDPK